MDNEHVFALFGDSVGVGGATLEASNGSHSDPADRITAALGELNQVEIGPMSRPDADRTLGLLGQMQSVVTSLMCDVTRQVSASDSDTDPAEVLQELRDVVLAYFRQEAVDPLRRLAAWLGFGLAGGVFVCTGLVLLALAGLRALQTETGDHLTGSLSWTPYAIVLAAVVVVFLLARSAARARRRGTEEVAE